MRALLLAFLAVGLSACISIEASDQPRVSDAPLCNGSRQLGRVVVVPTVSWRSDQKEPERRQAMISTGLADAFASLSCGEVAEVRGVRRAEELDREALVETLRADALETLIEVHFTELGPLLTLSVPVLISTRSDIQFTLRATDVASGNTAFEIGRSWQRGGAFAIRPASVLPADLVLALADLLEP